MMNKEFNLNYYVLIKYLIPVYWHNVALVFLWLAVVQDSDIHEFDIYIKIHELFLTFPSYHA
jgi:hypothetical protein